MPEDMPDRMPEDMPDRMPEDMPDRMPEDLPDRMPEHMPEDMPDRMPEDMPEHMPEDLRVTKGINVMVGITRSKVIACIFMYLHLVSMSRLHPSSLNNFLRSSCFNIEFSLPPMCLSISCIHFASYVNFPHWPLHHFLRFVVSIFEPPLRQQLLACILHQYLNSSHPVPGPKKHVQVQKKEGAKVQKHPPQCERL